MRNPVGFEPGRAHQGLHHHAILLGFLLQSAQLFRGCLRRGNIKMKMNVLKADGHVFCNSERASEVQPAFHRDLNALGWDAHRRSHHLAGNLRASRQRPKQKITGTGAGTAASNALVGLCLVNGTPDVYRACYGNAGLSTFCPDDDLRGIGITAVVFFQRFLKRSEIHGNVIGGPETC